MNSKEYIKDAVRTESTDFSAIDQRLQSIGTKRLLHAGIGLATESGEFLDALKKHIFYGKDLDRVNLAEEIGDIFWYTAIIADELGFDFESVMKNNIEKLRARYGDKFSQDKAENRNLNKERDILENQDLKFS